MDETSTLAFHRRDGKPAVGARVQLYGAADTGLAPRVQVIADANGGVDLPTPEKGYYNLVVRGREGDALFQDSLYSNGTVFSAASDTLLRTGVLRGRIRVQPQHSPRIAWIHVLGAGIWSNVDDSGKFKLEGVPAGRYTLAAYTLVEGYTPTFAQVKTISDSTVDAGDIPMVFTGLPVVQNLEARFDTMAGLVHLRWDSIPLRETWRYNVYRNDTLLGPTTGARWVDDVSHQYPANVPAQGRHTYRVALADAGLVGPQWESITLQVISPFLYQELKIDWEKRADLPWQNTVYRIDTAQGKLVCWALKAATRNSAGIDRWSADLRDYLAKWVSRDSGMSWSLADDSVHLSALPVRYEGLWWSVLLTPIVALEKPTNDSGRVQLRMLRSTDGIQWDLVDSQIVSDRMDQWRMESVPGTIVAIGGFTCNYPDPCPDENWGYSDRGVWFLKGGRFESVAGTTEVPYIRISAGLSKQTWGDGAWWKVSGLGSYQSVADTILPQSVISNGGGEALSFNPALMGYHLFREHGLILEFGADWALSMDLKRKVFHRLAWPGRGPHLEMRYAGGYLSASDAGIYVGKVREVPAGDPRGTWVKKTEVPVRY